MPHEIEPLAFSINLAEQLTTIIPQKQPINFMEGLIHKIYDLGAAPKIDPKFIESFIASNKIQYTNPEFLFLDPKTHVGIEVEVENVSYINPNIPLCFWKVTEDGSLRNHGKEFKSAAISLRHAQLALELLFQGLNPDIDFSKRTSIHVHVDVRGLTINQLLTLLFVYTVVENLLFKFTRSDRRNSIFCTPITETTLLTDLNIRDPVSLENHFKHIWKKYSALNILPITTFGTVEFRQMPGTRDITKLCIWLDLLSRIRLFAYQHTLVDILSIIYDLNTNSQYRRFVESVFGNLTSYLDITSLMADMEKAVFICKNCTAVNNFHQYVLNPKSYKEESMLSKRFGSILRVRNLLTETEYITFSRLRKAHGPFTTDEHCWYTIFNVIKDFLRYYKDKKDSDMYNLLLFIQKNPIN